MLFPNGVEDQSFYVELKQLPDVLLKLLQRGYLDFIKKENFDILKISNNGVILYISSFYGGDGYVFLPSENIISIHTLYDEFLDTIK